MVLSRFLTEEVVQLQKEKATQTQHVVGGQICWGCWERGHIRCNCPKSGQQRPGGSRKEHEILLGSSNTGWLQDHQFCTTDCWPSGWIYHKLARWYWFSSNTCKKRDLRSGKFLQPAVSPRFTSSGSKRRRAILWGETSFSFRNERSEGWVFCSGGQITHPGRCWTFFSCVDMQRQVLEESQCDLTCLPLNRRDAPAATLVTNARYPEVELW